MAGVQEQTDPDTGQPEVLLTFTHRGGKAFQRITKAEYTRGRLVAGLHGSAGKLKQLYAQHSAIGLDRTLLVTPYIDYTDPLLSSGIAGGQAVIGNLTKRAASNLAIILGGGWLPVSFTAVR
jgi:preprotein translocase subunit SecD